MDLDPAHLNQISDLSPKSVSDPLAARTCNTVGVYM